jgi:hypothetical protein
MKRTILIFFTVLFSVLNSQGQVTKSLELFRTNLLPQYILYFSQANLTESQQLSLTATEKYNSSAAFEKNSIMNNITTAWRESLVLVHFGTKSELWSFNNETGSAQLLDEWDVNLTVKNSFAEMNNKPWFCYVGGQFTGDIPNHTINFALNLRLGFFLLKNRWDFAASYSTGLTAYISDESSSSQGWSNYSLMSRVHFPIKEYKISPNIGLEVNYGEPVTFDVVIGLSWFIGAGSLDIGFKFGGTEFTSMGGYTMSPRISRK